MVLSYYTMIIWKMTLNIQSHLSVFHFIHSVPFISFWLWIHQWMVLYLPKFSLVLAVFGLLSCIRDPQSVHLVTESPSLFSHCLSLACSARLLATTIVFGAGVPREASCLPVLWTELPVWTKGGVDHLFISSTAWKEAGEGLLMQWVHYDPKLLLACVWCRRTHTGIWIFGEVNNRERSASNDNDHYYYCRGDVGNVVNWPHAESFPLVCLALPVNTALQHVLFDGLFSPSKPVPMEVRFGETVGMNFRKTQEKAVVELEKARC